MPSVASIANQTLLIAHVTFSHPQVEMNNVGDSGPKVGSPPILSAGTLRGIACGLRVPSLRHRTRDPPSPSPPSTLSLATAPCLFEIERTTLTSRHKLTLYDFLLPLSAPRLTDALR